MADKPMEETTVTEKAPAAKAKTGGAIGGPGRLPTDTTQPTFMLRKRKGRDGSGPCGIINRTLMMPNGDIGPIGATFDPVVEKMTRVTYQRLCAKKRITAASADVENKLLKDKTVTKGKPGGGSS